MEVKMKLKIKIKEVKEEIRELTIEERCLVTVSRIPGGCSERYRAEASAKLDSIGFVSNLGSRGLFRTETIRDAALEEIIAWHCMRVWDIFSKTECLGVFEHIRHLPVTDEWVKAKELLEGKEVILELV